MLFPDKKRLHEFLHVLIRHLSSKAGEGQIPKCGGA